MLLKTSVDKKHSHVVFVRQDFTGECSIEKDHTHELIPLPEGEGIMFSIVEDHTHALDGPLDRGEKDDKKDENALIKEVKQLYKAAKNREEKSRKKADNAERFYRGEQWDDGDRQDLEGKNRACLTINEIEPKIDLLSGYQRQNRQDIRFMPVEGEDAKVAEILNVVVKNILDATDAEYEETAVFEDVLITGRGTWHIYLDRDENLEGDIKVERWPQTDIYFGPFEKPDQSDLEYLCKTKWYSRAKLEQLFPEKKDSFRAELDALVNADKDGFIHDEQSGDRYSEEGDEDPVSVDLDPDYINIAKKEYRVIECWRKEFKRVPVAFMPREGFYEAQEGISEKDVASIRAIRGMRVAYQNVHRMRMTSIAAGTLLHDEYPDDFDDFNIIPVFAKKRGEHYWGKVETVIDVQREINKRHSQTVDIMNKCAAYGWFYDRTTFRDPVKDKADWLKNSSSPGFNQEVMDRNKPPVQVDGVRFPTELVNLEELSTSKLREVMNINPEMLGINSKAESGVAIAEKKRQGLVGNEFLFDNLALSKKRLGRAIVRLIQRAYTPERILRVVQGVNSRTPQGAGVEIGGKPIDQYNPEEIKAMLANADLMKYDVAVTESAYSPTNRRYNFIVWSELAGRGIPVPPELLVDLSDLGDKDKVKGQIEAMKQAQMQQEKAKIDAEIQKTQISAQSRAAGPTGAGNTQK
jgi:hypothetical protein